MNLSDITYKDQYHTGMQTNTASGTAQTTDVTSGNGQNILSLQPGQQFRGTVVGMEGDRVSIQTQDNQVFTARLESGVNIEKGMTLSFEVKGIQGNQVSLTPLYSNMTASSSVMKALQMAGLPVTESSVRMVNEMMNQGMNIDKQSLQSMFQLAGQYDSSKIATIVQMKQLQLPVSMTNIEQFESYQNNTAQILDGYKQIGSELTGLMQDMAAKGDYEGLGKMFTEIMKNISADSLGQSDAHEAEQTLLQDGGKPVLQDGGQAVIPSAAGAPEGQSAKILYTENGIIVQENAQNLSGESATGITQNQAPANAPNMISGAEQNQVADIVLEKGITGGKEDAAVTVQQDTSAPVQAEGAGKALEAFMQAIRQAGDAEKGSGTDNTILQSDESVAKAGEKTAMGQPVSEEQFRDFVKDLTEQLKTASPEQLPEVYREAGQKLAQLVKSPDFEALLQNTLTKDLLLKPQEVSSKEQVQALYEKVLRQASAMSRILADAGQHESAAMKSVQSMARNVEFLNDLNQSFAFVQLPLKMSEQEAHGDLYVYTKKRNMAQKDGPVTALLHLEMDHLGDMDIYVAMQNQKVSTKFYLESEEMIDFLEGHMDELDSRLMQKGYSMKSELLHKDHKDSGNVFDELIADSKSRGRAPMVMLSRQSFDARA